MIEMMMKMMLLPIADHPLVTDTIEGYPCSVSELKRCTHNQMGWLRNTVWTLQ